MRFGSVCSGIEAASVAWLPVGWEAAWLSEISAFCCNFDAMRRDYFDELQNSNTQNN